MEKDFIAGFRSIFAKPGRRAIISMDYDRDVLPWLDDIKAIRYSIVSGDSIGDEVKKLTLPENANRIMIDVSLSESYTPKVSELSALTDLLSTYPNKDVETVWGCYQDSEQTEPAKITILSKVTYTPWPGRK